MAAPGPSAPEPAPGPSTALRQAVLAASVLDDIDLEPREDGVALSALPPVFVPWHTLTSVLDGAEPGSWRGRHRLVLFLSSLRAVARLGDEAGSVLADRSRALALPRGHVDHPGSAWVLEPLLGDALDLGVGVLGLLDDPDEVVPLHPLVADAARVDATPWWPRLRGHLEAMGALSAHRLARDGGTGRSGVLRPVGGCDVPTLLGSPTLRRYLADGDGSGLRALAVPMRTRGWYDLARIDPAFVGAAWSATPEEERAFSRPLLVTAEEVSLAVAGGDPVAAALADPAAPTPSLRDVRYR